MTPNDLLKLRAIKPVTVFFAIAVAANSTARAGSIVIGDPTPGGITYVRQVQLGVGDSASFTRHVGAWSWEDNSLFDASMGESPVGWTHTSDWVALTLSTPATLVIRMERQAGVPAGLGVAGTDSMYPSFTIWANWDNDDSDFDTYNNRGRISWAEDLAYIGHVDNSTQPTMEQTFVLPAGQYTVVLGSNAPATETIRQGYLATFSTVPEPASAGVVVAGLAVLMTWRKRNTPQLAITRPQPLHATLGE